MDSVRREGARAVTGTWWMFLVTGVLWLIISLIVLRFNVTSIATVGALLGVILLIAGANEFLAMSVRTVGWKWLHAILGVLFVIGGIWAFIHPIDAFWELASILGFLILLKGSMDIVGSVVTRDVNELWWLGLGIGILEVLLAFWVSQQFYAPRAAIIIIWVGFACLFRGISEIVLAFELRHAGKQLAAT